MTDFSQNMTAVAAVLVGAATLLKAVMTCVKALKPSITINLNKNAWWRRLGIEGWFLIIWHTTRMGLMIYGMHKLMMMTEKAVMLPLTLGGAAGIAQCLIFVLIGFYPPPVSMTASPPKPPAE